MARDVNFVWNYCNDVIRRRWKESRKYTSRYDLQKLTRGGYTDLSINAQYEERLAKAQRAGKKRRTKKIHLNIKNTRSDWNHKASNEIASKYSVIFVGSVSPSRLIKTKACGMAKSVNDAGWLQFKTFLKYKAIKHSGSMYEINENYSTVTCSTCSSRTGPSGLSDLGVRVWECSSCNSVHDRDTNAALNILRSGRGTLKEEAAW